MRRVGWTLLCLVMIGAFAQNALAQSARAVVDTNRLRIGESLTLRVVADFDGARVMMSELSDFRVSPRGTSSRIQMINGKTTREVESVFLMIPLREGTLTIPAIPVDGGKTRVYTAPLSIEVAERSAASQADEPWSVSAEISNGSPYVGEQLVWSFRFQTAARFQNAQLGKPDFNGFFSEELGEGRSFQKVVNGRPYTVHEVNQLLIPQSEGTVVIKPATLQAAMVTGKRRRSADPFMDDFFGNRNVVEETLLTTEPVSVTVRPLPPYSGKGQFSGLVGQFSLSASLEKREISAGDPMTLTVTIKGAGNIKDAGSPTIPLPEGMKHYGDTPVESITLGPSGWQGSKTFKTAVVPLEPGIVTIPPIQLVWFNPATKRYESSSSQPLVFTVAKGETTEPLEAFQAGELGVETPDPNRDKREVRMKGLDILPLKVGTDAVVHQAPMTLNTLAAALGAPLILFLMALTVIRRFARGVTQKESLLKRMTSEIKSAEQASASGNTDAYHKSLHGALTALMGAMAGRSVEAMTEEEIHQKVLATGACEEDARGCAAILESVEAARYGGGAKGEGSQKAQLSLLKRLAKEVK